MRGQHPFVVLGVGLGLFTWVTYSLAQDDLSPSNEQTPEPTSDEPTSDEQSPTEQQTTQSATEQQSPTELPTNPRLITPVPPAPDALDPSSAAADVHPPAKVRLGLNGGVMSRPAASAEATYDPAFTWGGHVGVVLLPWLDVRATSQVTSHGVDAHDGAWGLSNPGYDPPKLRELALGASLELRKQVVPGVEVWGGAGIAWARLTMSQFLLEEPWPAAVETRSGVTLQLPLHAGVGYSLGRPTEFLELGLTLEFRFAPVLTSSGELFSPEVGQRESVRSDTGQRVEIGGMPNVSASRTVLFGVEASIY